MRASASTAKDLGMPAIYLHTLAQLLRSIGIDDRSLLLRVGLDPDRLNATELRVSQAQASEFVTRAISESGEPGLGILLAQAMQPPTHGALGTAVMSSRNLGEALDLLTRYLTLRAPHWHVRKRLTQGQAWYTVTSEVDPGPLHNLILDAVLLGCVSMGTQLTGTPVTGIRILRRGPEPAYFQRFRAQIPVPVHYDATEDALLVPQDQLDLPLRFCDERRAAASRAECEQALQRLSEDAGFACRVRRVIETSYPFPPKLARVASTLFVSERTLKRRLQEEQASFQHLVDQVRLERARELLTHTGMNLSQIADALGYADAANFTRAFKRWTGRSPSRYRSEALAVPAEAGRPRASA